MVDRTRRPSNPRDAAEAAFKKATTKPLVAPPPRPVMPGGREQVTLRLDRAVLDHFQGGGPGWQDRINEALRQIVGAGQSIPTEDLNASNDK